MRRYLRAIKRRVVALTGPTTAASAPAKKAKPRPVVKNANIVFYEQLVAEGEITEAEAFLKDYLLNEPLDARATALFGECRLRMNDPATAAPLFQEAESLRGYDRETRRSWAVALMDLGREDEARALVLSSIDHEPRAWQLYWDYAAMVETPAHHAELIARWHLLMKKPAAVSDAIERAVAKSATLAEDFDLSYAIYRRLIATELSKLAVQWGAAPNEVIPKIIKEKKNELSGGKGEICLKDFKAALDGANFPFFLMAGTVLGYVRDGALLPGDKDVDIGVFDHDYDRAKIEDVLRNSGNFQILRVDDHADRIRAVHRNGVWVDVFPYFKEGKRTWHAGTVARWWHEPFELKEFDVDGTPFMIPADTDAYLEWNYGPDWRVPYGLFDVYEDAPNVEVMRQDFLIYSTWRKMFEGLKVRDWEKVLKYVSKNPDLMEANPWLRRLEVLARRQIELAKSA